MDDKVKKGILKQENGKPFLLGPDGQRHFEGERLWEGYVRHWIDRQLCARRLPQVDYDTGRPIVMLWPDLRPPTNPYFELYFNERLVRYPASIFGHIAINVDGKVFNFSHLLNENEVIGVEEYFYRPALGEFAPHPQQGGFSDREKGKPYYDKFGRSFMRTVHVLQVQGLEAESLSSIYHRELKTIHNAPVHPGRPSKYRDFNFLTRSCTTIIRDGLREWGFPKIRGLLPRELFMSAAYHFFKASKSTHGKIALFKKRQLKVPEAPYSVMTPLFNPLNRVRFRGLPTEKDSKIPSCDQWDCTPSGNCHH